MYSVQLQKAEWCTLLFQYFAQDNECYCVLNRLY